MHPSVKFLAFFMVTIASIAGADESIVGRLQKTGVKVHLAPKDDGLKAKPLNYLYIPQDWRYTDQSISLVREWISTLDAPITIRIPGPPDPGHDRIEKLKADFPLLTVHRASAVFLGVQCPVGPVACTVGGVVAGSSAESSGLKNGDIIVGVNETAITNFEELRFALLDFLPGDIVFIHVKRDSQDLQITVKLTSFPLPPS